MPRPLFLTGTARGGTNLLMHLLNVSPEISLTSDPFLPVFRSLRNALIAQRADAATQAGLDPDSPLSDYYFNPAGLRIMDCIQAADLNVPVDQLGWPALIESMAARTALASGHFVPHLHRIGGRTYLDVFRCILDLIADVQHAKDRTWVGFKEKWAIEFFAPLARAFPDARFISIIRDPRAGVTSNQHVREKEKIAHALSSARGWRKNLAFTRHYQQDPLLAGRFYALTYEQLLQQPERTAQGLCEFLEVPYDPAMVDTSRYIHPATGRVWGGNSSYDDTVSGIDPACIDRWRRYADPDAAAMVDFICDPEMRLFGYTPTAEERSAVVDAGVLEYVLRENQAPRKWRADFGEPELDLGCELFRKTLLRLPRRVDDALMIRRAFLFEEVFNQLAPFGSAQVAA